MDSSTTWTKPGCPGRSTPSSSLSGVSPAITHIACCPMNSWARSVRYGVFFLSKAAPLSWVPHHVRARRCPTGRDVCVFMRFLSPHSTHQGFFSCHHTPLNLSVSALASSEVQEDHLCPCAPPFQTTSGSVGTDLKSARASIVDAANHPLHDSPWLQPGRHNGDDVMPPTGEQGVFVPVSYL